MKDSRYQGLVFSSVMSEEWRVRLTELGVIDHEAALGTGASTQIMIQPANTARQPVVSANEIPRWIPPAEQQIPQVVDRSFRRPWFRTLSLMLIVLFAVALGFFGYRFMSGDTPLETQSYSRVEGPRDSGRTFNASSTNADKENGRQTDSIAEDERFAVAGDGIVLDSKTGLRWSGSDSLRPLSWQDAVQYCAARNQRLPSVTELQGLFDKSKSNACGKYACKVSAVFRLSDLGFWSNEQSGILNAWYVNLYMGYRTLHSLDSSSSIRALCVDE
jgi:hypothetical protein